jgi:hypothetical protein
MSLAMTAATLEPFDTNDNSIRQKRQQIRQHQPQSLYQNGNKTRKQNMKNINTFIDNDKVNSVLASIHKGFSDEDDEDTFLNIQTLSASSEKPSSKDKVSKIEKMTNQNEGDGLVPTPSEKSEMDLQKLESNYMNDDEVEKYYKKLMPGYEINRQYNTINENNNSSNNNSSNNNLYNNNSSQHNPVIDKLNYIINLLEEHQDQRTNNVTEEVILYSFLGVFIIFVVDGFTRVGKYVR